MSSNEPLFSIVLPTRDRPNLVSHVLFFLKSQIFTNFEVIVSDNSVIADCKQQFLPYSSDHRFKYVRPSKSLDMASNWEFAISFAKGKYVSIFSEKFMMRPDALLRISDVINVLRPDIISWQYDFFDVEDIGSITSEKALGSYHPFIKPGKVVEYDASSDLSSRFNFDFPVYSRLNRYRENYGKIYGGFVCRELVELVKSECGKVFYPLSPDFTSMVAFSNYSRCSVDMNEPLMLQVNASGLSNGVENKRSLLALQRYVKTYGIESKDYVDKLPISGFGIGHNNTIAAEFLMMKKLIASGPITSMNLDLESLAFWAELDLDDVIEWDDKNREDYRSMLTTWLGKISVKRKSMLTKNRSESIHPARNEIYHSGLEKISSFYFGISAKDLARVHWCEGKAPPRKPVVAEPMTLKCAMTFFTEYQEESRRLLELE